MVFLRFRAVRLSQAEPTESRLSSARSACHLHTSPLVPFAALSTRARIRGTMQQRVQDRRRRPERRARFEEIRAEIAARVRAVCRGLPPEECEALLSRMARVQLKYELAGLAEVS